MASKSFNGNKNTPQSRDDTAGTDENTAFNIPAFTSDIADHTKFIYSLSHTRSAVVITATTALGATVTIDLDETVAHDPIHSSQLQVLAQEHAADDTFGYNNQLGKDVKSTTTVAVHATGDDNAPGPAQVIYSNFAPGMTFDQNRGYVISGGFPPDDTERQTISQEFTPTMNYTFSDAKIAVSNYAGPGTLVAYLQADTNGLPGSVIETIPIDAGTTGVSADIITVNSVLSPVLQNGTHYWLTLAAAIQRVNPDWNMNSIGDSSNDTFASTLSGSPLGPWNHGFGFPIRAAFEIDGFVPVTRTCVESNDGDRDKNQDNGNLNERGNANEDASVSLRNLLTGQAANISMKDLLPTFGISGVASAQSASLGGQFDNLDAAIGGLAFAGVTDSSTIPLWAATNGSA